MKSGRFIFYAILWICLLSSCGSINPFYDKESEGKPGVHSTPVEAEYSFFLTGGIVPDETSDVIQAIRTAAGKKDGLVLLGDDVSLENFTSLTAEDDQTENKTYAFLQSLSTAFADFYLLPGEKEWRDGKKTSPSALHDLDKILKDVKEKGRLLVPAKDCGMPEVVRLNHNLVLVLMDSQWAIETEARAGENMAGCELNNVLEMRNAIKDIIQSHPADFIVFATHHPLYANGPTAGNYPLSSHLLPVPVLGTLITGVKSIIGSNQHFGHPAYEAYRSAFLTGIQGCKNCVVVSGHEASLQYFRDGDKSFLVAGSGNDVKHARKGEHAGFSYMSKGFVRIDALKTGHLRLAFFAVDHSSSARLVWEKSIAPSREGMDHVEFQPMDTSTPLQDSVLLPASTRYATKHFLRGEFYRAAWSLPIKMPVLYVDQVHGGLKPVQLGGGNQTRSLRLENDLGEQYVLRSIDKKVTVVLPPALRGSFAENIVQEGIAASHPYGALVIPRLAQAVDVYFTRPQVVYVPHQPALGLYDAEIGDGVYLFEERPGGHTSAFSNFGNTEKTYSTSDVLELIAESHKHQIDQQAVLRARLLDILLGDWDRHDDQWRWASFEEGEHIVYRPIPRDRDQVFYKNDGVLDYLASRPYFNPPLRKFTDRIDHLDGLIWAGKYFDRSFLHQLTKEDFITAAKAMQVQLTDDVIDAAFRDWPSAIDQLDGPAIRAALKARRDDLVSYAQAFYLLISEDVFIPATTDKDIIHLHAPADGMLDVEVLRQEKDHVYPYYHRLFDDQVTKEIRLFGLNKQDSVILTGPGSSSIVVRFVGGSGKDVLLNLADNVHIRAYDGSDGMVIRGSHVRRHLNDQSSNNAFDRTDWNLDRDFHFLSPTFYTDEGVGLTYTYWWTRYGFRNDPFKSKHAAGLSYYFGTNAFIGKYHGEWLHVFGSYDLELHAFFSGPTYTQYFYGLGNRYIDYGEKKNYHIVSGSQIHLAPSIRHRFGFGSMLSLSPSYQYINVEDERDTPRFIYSPESGLTPKDFGERNYLGLTVAYSFSRLDNPGYPSRGVSLKATAGGRTAVGSTSIHHGLLGAEASLYLPFDITNRVTLATHLGADKLFGDFEFFHALTLGGEERVRGYRTDRFAGESRFYHATDLRLKLFDQQGAVPFQLGLYLSFDYGRVWYEEDVDDADSWHTAYGGGVFIAPLGLTSFRIGYMTGEEDQQVTVGGSLKF